MSRDSHALVTWAAFDKNINKIDHFTYKQIDKPIREFRTMQPSCNVWLMYVFMLHNWFIQDTYPTKQVQVGALKEHQTLQTVF